jgi:hypothetical protein
MQIELLGCTGAGKSTLAQSILQSCRSRGVKAYLGDAFVLDLLRLDWVKPQLIRTLLVDFGAFVACLLTIPANVRLYCFSLRVILRLPGDVSWLEKLNLMRNVFKKIGIYEIIRRRDRDECLIVVDEGTLHAAHNLFVHVSAPPSPEDIATFARLVALPDAALYLEESEAVLIKRTLRRGHSRIAGGSRADVERFVTRAVGTFDQLVRELVSQKRIAAVRANRMIHLTRADGGDAGLGLFSSKSRLFGGAIAIDFSSGAVLQPNPEGRPQDFRLSERE